MGNVNGDSIEEWGWGQEKEVGEEEGEEGVREMEGASGETPHLTEHLEKPQLVWC